MAFDFKKEYKEFYMAKNKPEIVNVPKVNYIAVRGKGNPNQVGGAYQEAVGILYAVAYTLKMSYKTAIEHMPSAKYELPYDGGKEMLLVEDTEDKNFLGALFKAMYDDLPLPKKNDNFR